jgi:hypothetical protein
MNHSEAQVAFIAIAGKGGREPLGLAEYASFFREVPSGPVYDDGFEEGEGVAIARWLSPFDPEGILREMAALKGNAPEGMIPLAATPGGDYFRLVDAYPGVWFWDHKTDELTDRGLGVGAWIGALKKGPFGSDLERIMRADDAEDLAALIGRNQIDLHGVDAYGRGLFENAAIYQSWKRYWLARRVHFFSLTSTFSGISTFGATVARRVASIFLLSSHSSPSC